MAMPQFAGYGHPDDVFPVHENMQKLPPTTRKRLAGNVASLSIVNLVNVFSAS